MDEILKNRPRGQKPWMTETILKKIAERDELFLKMKENPSEHARQIYEEQYRKVRNVIVTLTRRAKRDYKKSVKPHVESAMMMSLQQLSEPMMNGAAALGERVNRPDPKITVANQQPYYAHEDHAKYRSKIYHQPQNINLSQSAHNFGSTHIDFKNAGFDNYPIMIDRNLDTTAQNNYNFAQPPNSATDFSAGMTYKEYDSLHVQTKESSSAIQRKNSMSVAPVSPVLRQPKSPSRKNNFGFKAFSDREGCKPQIVTSSVYGWVDANL